MSLDLIRNQHSWFTKGILILITVTFVVGIGYQLADWDTLTGVPNRTAAKVNGEDIGLVNFYTFRDNLRKQLNQEGELPPGYEEQIDMIALNQLINMKLLAQKANDLGFKVTDGELNEAITTNPAFQIDGRFVGKEMYENYIRQALNQDVGSFENSYREDLLVEKLRKFIEETTIVTDESLLNSYNKQNEKINLYYIPFKSGDYAKAYSPTDEDIDKYYQAHKSNYMTPEIRTFKYTTIDPENFEKSIKVTKDEISSYYNAYSEEFTSDDGNTKPLSEVKAEIESKLKAQRGEVLRQQFISELQDPEAENKNLDDIASEYSATVNESAPVSAKESLQVFPPSVVRRAYGLDKGTTAVIPVGTSLWVVVTKEITPPREETLEESKDQVIADLKREKSNEIARKKAQEALSSLKRVKKENLQAEAKKLGLELKETGYFSRMDRVPDINAPDIQSKAFDIDEESAVGSKVYGDANIFYIVSVKDKQKADEETFELTKAQLKDEELVKQQSEIIRNMIIEMRRQSEILPNPELFPAQG